MYEILEHPEIGWIERTGYPSWAQESDQEPDEDAIYEANREDDYGW